MNYNRINKPTARRMFNKGYCVQLLPCKVNENILQIPEDNLGWLKPTEISLSTSNHEANHFDRTVNEYEYYNCNAELGYYAHYYVSEEDYNKYKEEQNSVAWKHQ